MQRRGLSRANALNRQTLAAFGAAGINDGTTAFGLHANQKTVGALTADFGGLIGTFHVMILLNSPILHLKNGRLSKNLLLPVR